MPKRGIQAILCHRYAYIQKYSKQHDVTCRGDSWSPLSRMGNGQTCAQSVTRDDDEDVSKKANGYEDEEVDETPEDAGVEGDEDGEEVATDMRNPCSSRTEGATRKHHQLTHQCVRRRMPAFPHRWWGGGVHEENVTQTNQCIEKLRPQEDLITIRVGMDDSGEAMCVEYEGTRHVWSVTAIARLARAVSQPHPTIRNHVEPSTVKVVRQTRNELQVEMQPVIPEGIKRRFGTSKQGN